MNFIRLNDYTWWLWFIIASSLLVGLLVSPIGLWLALTLSAIQALAFVIKERSLSSFPVQLRIAYLLILLLCSIPALHILFWVPTIGTYALCFFGYCLLARILSLIPWNRTYSLTMQEVIATFTVAPDMHASDKARSASGCPGGVCSLDVQLARMKKQ